MTVIHFKDLSITVPLKDGETPEEAEDRIMDALEPFGAVTYTTEIEELEEE